MNEKSVKLHVHKLSLYDPDYSIIVASYQYHFASYHHVDLQLSVERLIQGNYLLLVRESHV